MSEPPVLDVVGIGNALVDVLVSVPERLVAEAGLLKGTMTLMGLEAAERVHAMVPGGVTAGVQRCGGSAANTVAGLVALGARGGFVGKVADDVLGRVFLDDLGAIGVDSRGVIVVPPGPAQRSGRCLILITPDAERTMCTSLGVAGDLVPEELDRALIASAAVTYMEGFLLDQPVASQALGVAIRVAHEAGRLVAMSLSDPLCVERHGAELRALVYDELDVVFGNEVELRALTGTSDLGAACAALRRPGLVLVVTRGAAGAWVVSGAPDGRGQDASGQHGVVAVEAAPVPGGAVVDVTGAGDLFAAGFLFGLVRGADMETCARIGALAAAEVIGHIGPRPEAPLATLVAPLLRASGASSGRPAEGC